MKVWCEQMSNSQANQQRPWHYHASGSDYLAMAPSQQQGMRRRRMKVAVMGKEDFTRDDSWYSSFRKSSLIYKAKESLSLHAKCRP